MKTIGIIQAHSKGWGGREDFCLRKVKGEYVISAVIKKMKKIKPIDEIIIAVPDVPENSIFKKIADEENVHCFFGSISNVLDRFINAAESIGCDIIVRVLGQHYFFNPVLIERMIKYRLDKNYDFVQTPDDFDCKLSGEIFTLNALKKVGMMLEKIGEDSEKYKARPFPFIRENERVFKMGIYENIPKYSKEDLINMRESNKMILEERDNFIDEEGCEIGDYNRIRYQTVLPYIHKNDFVFDIACGTGYGSDLISRNCRKVVGVDIDPKTIENNKKPYTALNLSFEVGDALNLRFENNFFDKIVSIETIEHIQYDIKFINEMHRILKLGGLFIVSTPQNRDGALPLNPWHVREYSLEEFRDILKEKFEVLKIVGAKRGIITNDEKGDNMIAICKKLKCYDISNRRGYRVNNENNTYSRRRN